MYGATSPILAWINEHLANPSEIGVVCLAVSYTALVIIVRWQMIARPIRNTIEARIKLLETEAYQLGKGDERFQEAVSRLTAKATAANKGRGAMEALFWSRGKETAIWQMIDTAESYLIYTWSTDKLVIRLASINAHLRELQDPAAKDLTNRISTRLGEEEAARKGGAHHHPSHKELCELHREAVRIERESLVAGDRDSDYFNNKIVWHIMVSLAALVFVANIGPALASDTFRIPVLQTPTGTFQITATKSALDEATRHAFLGLLLAGAIGGILSRLTRALRMSENPTERGLSWMAMFLSPLVGALAGWAGGMMLLAGRSLNLVIPSLEPEQLWLVLTSFAVLFGFSERLFTGLAEKLENNLVPAQKTDSQPASSLPLHEGKDSGAADVNKLPAPSPVAAG